MTYKHMKRFASITIVLIVSLLFIAVIQTAAQKTGCDGCPDPTPEVKEPESSPDDADGDGVWDTVDRCPDRGGPAQNEGCPNGDVDGDYIYDPQDLCPQEYAPDTEYGCLATTNIDPDGDGILGDDDRCPDIAGNEQNYGCVWFDTDGDGVIDDDDLCKFEDGVVEFDGCPYDADNDYDGVRNADDLCPLILGVPELAGCPPDYDLDGIPTLEDECPYERGIAELNGCAPEPVDTDGDGLLDEDDRCPNDEGPEDNLGCPVIPPIIIISEPMYDLDEDGFYGDEDHCPEVHSTRNNGCPLPNWDGDDLANIEDGCPRVAGPISNNGCPVENPTDVEPQLLGTDLQQLTGSQPENDIVCEQYYTASATVAFTDPRDWSAPDYTPSRHASVTFMIMTSWDSYSFSPKVHTRAVPYGGHTSFSTRFDIDPDVPYAEPDRLEINVWGNDYAYEVLEQEFSGPHETCASSTFFAFVEQSGDFDNIIVDGQEDPPPTVSTVNLLIGQIPDTDD